MQSTSLCASLQQHTHHTPYLACKSTNQSLETHLKRWPTLLPELVARLSTDDLAVVNGVAATANSIFKRYRNQYGSNELVAELAASQDVFAPPALEALQRIGKQLPALAATGQAEPLRTAVSTLRLLCRVFYSLNSPGLTPLIESQLDAWMAEFHALLTFADAPALAEADASKEAPLDALKAAVCANVNLFMEMNEEEFAKFLQVRAWVAGKGKEMRGEGKEGGAGALCCKAPAAAVCLKQPPLRQLSTSPGPLMQHPLPTCCPPRTHRRSSPTCGTC